MKLACLFPVLLFCAPAFAQSSDLFDKAPPEVDEALRARITVFYGAHISKHYRDALAVVAPDAIDHFLEAGQDPYHSCEISKLAYSENFTKAVATTACKTDFRWHGQSTVVTVPFVSNWKFVDGQWWWYYIRPETVMTPWGVSRVTPENSGPAQMPVIPKDPVLAAQDILGQVKVDKSELELKSTELSKGEVLVTNNMPGGITVTVDSIPVPGLHAKVDQPDLNQGGKATVVFSYDPKDPAIQCNECSTKAAMPTVVANIRIIPTGRVYPVKITFAAPPPVEKHLPKLPTAPK